MEETQDPLRPATPAATPLTTPATAEPLPGAAPAKPRRRGRTCCLGCLALALLPLAGLAVLALWINSAPAPAPSVCLPPDAPVQAAFRDPAGTAGRFLSDPRWREFLAEGQSGGNRLPPVQELGVPLFLTNQLLGDEAAVSTDHEGAFVCAARPGILARLTERLARGELRKNPEFGYELLGRTLVFARNPAALKPVLDRREELLASREPSRLPADAAAQVRLRELCPGKLGAPPEQLRKIEAVLDLSSAESISGELRLDRALGRLTGGLAFPPGSGGAPPALPAAGPASARLVGDDALAYWVWHAPAGTGRWSPAGRLGALLGSTADLEAGLDKLKAAGLDGRKLLAEQLVGERGLAVSAQAREGGKPLLAAAALMFECRDPGAAWPEIRKVLGALYTISADGRPPQAGDLPVYPHLVERRYKTWPYLELVYAHYPLGSGYRPAFGMVGRFLVATTSRAELERMLDRAASPAGRSLAAGGELAAAGGAGGPLSGLLVVRPEGHGQELADLSLALSRGFAEPGAEAGDDDAAVRQSAALGKFLSNLRSLRAEWRAQKDGSLRLELDAALVPPAPK